MNKKILKIKNKIRSKSWNKKTRKIKILRKKKKKMINKKKIRKLN